jgi:uncharacterized membrane protein
MSNTSANHNKSGSVRVLTETKSAYKTTEFIAYVVILLGILIASAVVDNADDGSGFDANHAWMYVTWLTIGYMISRGLAKSGRSERERHDRDRD